MEHSQIEGFNLLQNLLRRFDVVIVALDLAWPNLLQLFQALKADSCHLPANCRSFAIEAQGFIKKGLFLEEFREVIECGRVFGVRRAQDLSGDPNCLPGTRCGLDIVTLLKQSLELS